MNFFLFGLLAQFSCGCQKETKEGPVEEYAVLTTSVGDVVIDLFEDDAPKHAENFKKLVKQGFYNGLTFHRVIENFMAQGGDPQGNGSGGPGYTLPAEIKRPHLRGSVAAARLGDAGNPQKNSSGSQFYICFAPQPNLDRMGYTVFGQVVKGMEVVDKIQLGDPGQNGLVPPAQRTKILGAKLAPASTIQK
ncbi:MAG: peptidylprolyl isomerase [Planctomycetes bacterium]|nr:peptidylprolyl isomerase [Planctomycetota bacterium]